LVPFTAVPDTLRADSVDERLRLVVDVPVEGDESDWLGEGAVGEGFLEGLTVLFEVVVSVGEGEKEVGVSVHLVSKREGGDIRRGKGSGTIDSRVIRERKGLGTRSE
jgi:hypothetical protein